MPDNHSTSESALACADVWKVFRSGRAIVKAVQNASLTVQRGEVVCLRGPSGSGKSTLLSMMGGLERPTKGEISGLGKLYSQLTMFELSELRRRFFGFVFQELSLIPHLTAAENLVAPRLFQGFPRKLLTQQGEKLLEMVGLSHRATHYPRELSYGERQRVAIGRALANDPSIVFADEPTANLDNANVERLARVIEGLRMKRVTVLMVTHDNRIEGVASRFFSMNDGVLSED